MKDPEDRHLFPGFFLGVCVHARNDDELIVEFPTRLCDFLVLIS